MPVALHRPGPPGAELDLGECATSACGGAWRTSSRGAWCGGLPRSSRCPRQARLHRGLGVSAVLARSWFRLVGFNVLEPVAHLAADLQVLRPAAEPPPALQRARADVPAGRRGPPGSDAPVPRSVPRASASRRETATGGNWMSSDMEETGRGDARGAKTESDQAGGRRCLPPCLPCVSPRVCPCPPARRCKSHPHMARVSQIKEPAIRRARWGRTEGGWPGDAQAARGWRGHRERETIEPAAVSLDQVPPLRAALEEVAELERVRAESRRAPPAGLPGAPAQCSIVKELQHSVPGSA